MTYSLSYVNGNASLSEKAPNPTLKLVVRFPRVSTKTIIIYDDVQVIVTLTDIR